MREENSDDRHARKELKVTWVLRDCTFYDGNNQEIRAPYSGSGLAKGASGAKVQVSVQQSALKRAFSEL